MNRYKDRILLELETGETVLIEAQFPPEEGLVERGEILQKLNFSEISETIRTCSKGLVNTFNSFTEDIKPNKATAEFGVEVGVESGELTSYIVNTSGKAAFKITLEWELK